MLSVRNYLNAEFIEQIGRFHNAEDSVRADAVQRRHARVQMCHEAVPGLDRFRDLGISCV